jgi:hypothetical protein
MQISIFKQPMHNFIINPDDKFYPNADNWMWDYCIFLGKFTDSKGKNYDLGVHIENWVDNNALYRNVSDATVYDNKDGSYTSGSLTRNIEGEDREWKLEVIRRAKAMNLIK